MSESYEDFVKRSQSAPSAEWLAGAKQERAAVVAWLREYAKRPYSNLERSTATNCADLIERGEHNDEPDYGGSPARRAKAEAAWAASEAAQDVVSAIVRENTPKRRTAEALPGSLAWAEDEIRRESAPTMLEKMTAEVMKDGPLPTGLLASAETPNACPTCDAPRGADHGILCPIKRSDAPTPSVEPATRDRSCDACECRLATLCIDCYRDDHSVQVGDDLKMHCWSCQETVIVPQQAAPSSSVARLEQAEALLARAHGILETDPNLRKLPGEIAAFLGWEKKQ